MVGPAPSPKHAMQVRRSRTKADIGDTRRQNRALLFDLLYRGGPMTRAQLSRTSGLTAPTVSAAVADLIADHLVIDAGESAPTRPGKPASVLQINDVDAVVVVADISTDTVVGTLNLLGEVLHTQRLEFDRVNGVVPQEAVCTVIERLVQEAAQTHHVVGVGLAVSGVLDAGGRVLAATHLGWTDVPLADLLSARIGMPVHACNDVKSATMAARQFYGVEAHNLMLVSIEYGVGAGLVIGDQLVEGEVFAAGEIGHLSVNPTGVECECGRHGCLDAYLNPVHLRPRMEAHGDAALVEAGVALGLGLAGVMSALNLTQVVIAGAADIVGSSAFLNAATETVRDRIQPGINAEPHLLPLTDTAELMLRGALALVVADLGAR